MLLVMSGALRAASTNRKLVLEAARLYGGPFVEADLRLPLYDGDLETRDGLPEAVARLNDQIAAAEAVAISTPEYNKMLPGVLKNALDWISRTKGNPWRGKPVAVMSAAAGREGGARAQMSLRQSLLPFRPRVIPGPELMLANSGKEFDDEGRLLSERYTATLAELMEALHDEVQLTSVALSRTG